MQHPIIRRVHGLRLAAALVLLGSIAPTETRAQYYQLGDVVQDFIMTNRTTRVPTHLTNFNGKIVLFDWFAWWCPYCQADAPVLKSQVDDYYATNGGNAYGLPYQHVGVNLQCCQEAQTSNFIYQAGLTFVLEDFGWVVASRFQAAQDQPIYVIINCVTNSPNTSPYQLLFHLDNHGNNFLDTAPFKAAIDSVRAPLVAPTLSTARVTNGAFTFTLNGPQTQNYRIDVSSNLSSWTTLSNISGASLPAVIKDPLGPSLGRRYYRGVGL